MRAGDLLVSALGVLLLVFGLYQELAPRPRFAGATPPAGARLDAPPREVRVWFTAPIDPGSKLSIAVRPESAGVLAPGERAIAESWGPDPVNPLASSLRVALPNGTPRGFYVVRWVTAVRGWTIARGSLVFCSGIDPGPEPFGRAIEKRPRPSRGGWWGLVSISVVLIVVPLIHWWGRGGLTPDAEARREAPPVT